VTPSEPPSQPPPSVTPPSVRPNGLLSMAVVAVLLAGLLAVAAMGSTPEPDGAATRGAPSTATPSAAGSAPESATAAPDRQTGTDDGGIDVATVEAGTPVSLPGQGSRDWVAPGASADGALVRAGLAEESIEFRAANTQPGLRGAFRLSWSGGTRQNDRGDANLMLGVRPGGRVEFVIRPLTSPADLVMHLSGNDAAVIVRTDDGSDSTRRIFSAPAAVVTVPLPANKAATVTVTPAGDEDIGVATAELR
jgi:hypothetical protein